MKNTILVISLTSLLSGCLAHAYQSSKLRAFAKQNNLDYLCVKELNDNVKFMHLRKVHTDEGRKEMLYECKKEEK